MHFKRGGAGAWGWLIGSKQVRHRVRVGRIIRPGVLHHAGTRVSPASGTNRGLPTWNQTQAQQVCCLDQEDRTLKVSVFAVLS